MRDPEVRSPSLIVPIPDADPVSILVTFIFCLGDLEAVVETPTGQPYIAVVLNATKFVAAAKALVVVIFLSYCHILSMPSQQFQGTLGKPQPIYAPNPQGGTLAQGQA